MIDSLKQKILILLAYWGWYRNPKEVQHFKGKRIIATKGAFFRQHETDDAWLFLLSRHHTSILDIGCNIGQSSMLMLVDTDNQMVCVDPNPLALSRCAENLIFNNLAAKVHFVNGFVGEEEGAEVEFFTIGAGAAGSMFRGFARSAAKHRQSSTVKTRTVASICRQLQFTPDLIKIDVEGAERLVLQGIDDNVLSFKPTLFVEMHSGVELTIEENTNHLLQWCAAKKYEAYYLRMHSLLKAEDVKKRGRYHALLIPQGECYPEYLKNIPENSSLSSVLVSTS